jgi:hypothetical protein
VVLDTSDAIALSSAVVALCALGISLWQGYVSRRHSILSVQPHVELVITYTQSSMTVSLKNGGLGPAFIESVELGPRRASNELNLAQTMKLYSTSSYQMSISNA